MTSSRLSCLIPKDLSKKFSHKKPRKNLITLGFISVIELLLDIAWDLVQVGPLFISLFPYLFFAYSYSYNKDSHIPLTER